MYVGPRFSKSRVRSQGAVKQLSTVRVVLGGGEEGKHQEKLVLGWTLLLLRTNSFNSLLTLDSFRTPDSSLC